MYCPYIPGHGTTPEDLSKTQWTEWTYFAEETYLRLKEKHPFLFVGGLSFGGTLALHLATRFNITGVIGMACGTNLHMPSLYVVPFAKYILKFRKKTVTKYMHTSSDILKRKTYDVFPLHAVHELMKFYKYLSKNLTKILSPLLLLHSIHDQTILFKNAQDIIRAVSSTDKELIALENSYHIITLDGDKDYVNSQIFRFIKNRF